MSQPQRSILTVVCDLDVGGTQRYAQNCAVWYARNGLRSTVLGYRAGGVREQALRDAGCRVVISPSPDRLDAALRDALDPGTDVVHIQRPGAADPEWTPILRTVRDHTGRNGARPARVMETSHFARADHTDDRRLIDLHIHLSRWCHWKWTRWSSDLSPRPVGITLPLMVDAAPFYPEPADKRAAARAAAGIPADAFVFGRIGQASMAKWSPVIFDAFAPVAQAHPNAWLVLVCAPPEMEDAARPLPAGVRERVRFMPKVVGDDALRSMYTMFDVFLHAAQIGESFGMVLAESMLCQVPVISQSVPEKDNSQPEVVGHNRGGLIVYSAADMARAMTELMTDPQRRALMGEQGRAWVLKEYAPERIGSSLLKAVDALCRTTTPDQLRAELAREGLQTGAPDAGEVRRRLRDAIGAPTLKQRLLMELVHQPKIYRLYFGRKQSRMQQQPR